MAGGPLPHFTLPEKTGDLPDLRDMAADMAVAFARVIVWEPAGQALAHKCWRKFTAGEHRPVSPAGHSFYLRIIWTPPAWRNF